VVQFLKELEVEQADLYCNKKSRQTGCTFFLFRLIFEQKGFDVNIIENPVNLSLYQFCKKEKIRPRIVWMRAFTDVYDPLMAVRVAKGYRKNTTILKWLWQAKMDLFCRQQRIL
jgi:hypothetical protein